MRVNSPALDSIIWKEFPVLDHGFVRVIDYMGDDTSIVQAARVSYGAGTKKSRSDERLIRYLMQHNHSTPFEMCEIKLHIKLPIFVARQWIRHRTANVNEYSMRYSKILEETYIPDQFHLQGQQNKQLGDTEVDGDLNGYAKHIMHDNMSRCAKDYRKLIEKGVAREEARIIMNVGCYTEWYWKIDLHNLLRFLQLRCGAGAQREIREYANVISDIVKLWTPITYVAFIDNKLNGARLSSRMVEAIKMYNAGKSLESLDLSKSELNYVRDTLNMDLATKK